MPPIDVDYDMGQIGHHLPSRGVMQTDGQRIADAAIAVGVHPTWSPSPHRTSNAFDARWREELLLAVLDWSSGTIQKHAMYDEELDKTEKGFASYHIGMTFALLWAREVLAVQDLAHVDRILENAGIHSNERRPDLLGADSTGVLYAIEAKGRSRGIGDAIKRGKRQITESRYWFSLNGVSAIGVVTATHFENDTLSLYAEDPESWARQYSVSTDLLRTIALEPYAEAISREGPDAELELPTGHRGAEIGDTGVLVALAPRVSEVLRLAGTRQPPQRQRSLVSKKALLAELAEAQEETLLPIELPGRQRYLQVADVIDLELRDEQTLEFGSYRGRESPSGVAVLVDSRWGALDLD